MNKLNNNCFTKDEYISIYNYLFRVLCSIGFPPSSIGTKFIIELTLFYYSNSNQDLKLEDLYLDFINYSNLNISKSKIRSNVNSCFNKINFIYAQKNFSNIFKIPFDNSFFTVKNIIIFLINLINIKKDEAC